MLSLLQNSFTSLPTIIFSSRESLLIPITETFTFRKPLALASYDMICRVWLWHFLPSFVFVFSLIIIPFSAYFFSSFETSFSAWKETDRFASQRKGQIIEKQSKPNAYEICNQKHTHTHTHAHIFNTINVKPFESHITRHGMSFGDTFHACVYVCACVCVRVCMRNKWVQHTVEDLSWKMHFQASFPSGDYALAFACGALLVGPNEWDGEKVRKCDWSGRNGVCVCVCMCERLCVCVRVCTCACMCEGWKKSKNDLSRLIQWRVLWKLLRKIKHRTKTIHSRQVKKRVVQAILSMEKWENSWKNAEAR